jgi:hypothetical protein
MIPDYLVRVDEIRTPCVHGGLPDRIWGDGVLLVAVARDTGETAYRLPSAVVIERLGHNATVMTNDEHDLWPPDE